jgi:hypothetical protein
MNKNILPFESVYLLQPSWWMIKENAHDGGIIIKQESSMTPRMPPKQKRDKARNV